MEPSPQRTWCPVCCGLHGSERICPGELPATGPELRVWRVNAETPEGIEAYGVLLAPSYDLWRARILTMPNVLWLAPGGRRSIKLAGATPHEAQRKAIDLIHDHCLRRGYRLRRETQLISAARVAGPGRPLAQPQMPAERKIRFLPIQFGVVGASEAGGTGNLSETGVFIITDAPLDQGTQLTMALKVDHGVIPLRGRVRWNRRQFRVGLSPGMGVELLAPPDPYVEFVRGLC
jgi:hypothetical protein